jgi:hypothetical protein
MQVRVVHRYLADDDDELSLEPDDIVDVIPYKNPDEQVCFVNQG